MIPVLIPWQGRAAWRQFVFSREIKERGEYRQAFDLTGLDELRNGEGLYLRAALSVDIGERRIGGAQIDPDYKTRTTIHLNSKKAKMLSREWTLIVANKS
jgi:hypothetical protein